MGRSAVVAVAGIAIVAGVIGIAVWSGGGARPDSGKGHGKANPPGVQVYKFASVVWEAEDAIEIEPPMRKVEAKLGNLIGGAGYLEIPDKSNPYEVDKPKDDKDCPKCEKPAEASLADQPRFSGRAVYKVELPDEGEYHLWVRCWWLDGCGNSIFVKIDDGPYRQLAGDSTYEVWRWREEISAGRPKTFRLAKGPHRIELRNREDGPKFDQLMLTTDPSNPGDEVIK